MLVANDASDALCLSHQHPMLIIIMKLQCNGQPEAACCCLLQMLPASTAGGGLLSEDNSWGRLLIKLPLKHPSKANKQAGEIELEVG
jgi:hypothetical protein